MPDIKQIRKENKITQKELGVILEVDQSVISLIEKGNRPVPERWKKVLGERFNIDPETITNSESKVNLEKDDYIKQLEERIKKQDAMLETLQKAIDALTNKD